jgi:hypothetical protein
MMIRHVPVFFAKPLILGRTPTRTEDRFISSGSLPTQDLAETPPLLGQPFRPQLHSPQGQRFGVAVGPAFRR